MFATSRQVNTSDNTSNDIFLSMVGRMSLGGLEMPFSPHDDEEMLTRRYDQNISAALNGSKSFGTGMAADANTAYFTIATLVPTRAAPSVGFVASFAIQYAGSLSAPTTLTGSVATPESFRVVAGMSGSPLTTNAAVRLIANSSTTAAIKLNARLS